MIPTYEDLMRPLLEALASRGEMTMAEARATLAIRFGLSEHELRERIPSGRTTTWSDRVHWSKQYLSKAGALDTPRRGVIRANATGGRLLAENPERIDRGTLAQQPEFRAWVTGSSGSTDTEVVSTQVPPGDGGGSRTPREQLEQAYEELKREIVESLIEHVKTMTPDQFELLVVDLMTALGYGGAAAGSAEHLGGSGDGGVDGVIREDPLGLDLIYLQAKRWEGTVSRPAVQAFAGSLDGFRAHKGVFITTSTFTREAVEYAGQIEKRIVLIDGQRLGQLMYDSGLGVSIEESYVLRAIDSDFFQPEPE